jgi:hypothetical protein
VGCDSRLVIERSGYTQSRRKAVRQVAIIARLKDGAEPRAAELLAKGPPFDPAERGFERHAVYLSATEVVFVFEGRDVDSIVDDMIAEPFSWLLSAALDEWRALVEESPRIARPAYFWEAPARP